MMEHIESHSNTLTVIKSIVGVSAIELIHQLPLAMIPFIDWSNVGFQDASDVIKTLCQVVVAFYTVKNLRKKKK